MATIYLADLDSRIVDVIVEREEQDNHNGRVMVAFYALTDAFIELAGEEVDIRSSRRWSELDVMAEEAAIEWSERYGSVSDRRVVFIKMFPRAEEIINILKTPQDTDWIENFSQTIDVEGFPTHWDNSLRQHALEKGYRPINVLRMHAHDPDFILKKNDVEFIKMILDTYDE